jgi:hypothetical protein
MGTEGSATPIYTETFNSSSIKENTADTSAFKIDLRSYSLQTINNKYFSGEGGTPP